MDDQKISSFLALARTLNYTKAAEVTFKSQSVISRQILALEKELGIQLFYRTKRRVELTPAGRIFADGLAKMGGAYESLMDQALAAHSGYEGQIRIACLAGQILGDSLGTLLRGFQEEYPRIHLAVSAKSMVELREMFRDKLVDVIYGRRSDFSFLGETCFAPVCLVQGCFVVAKSHPQLHLLSSYQDIRELDGIPLVWSYALSSPPVLEILRDRERRNGDRNVLAAPDMDTMLLWVELGYGFTVGNSRNLFTSNPNIAVLPQKRFGRTEEGLVWRADNNNLCLPTLAEYTKKYTQSLHF